MTPKYIITPHAAQRWIERGDGDLMQELASGSRVGVQRGTDYLLLLPCEAVAVVAKGDRVKTILTKEQAIANMQMRIGWHAHGTTTSEKVANGLAVSLGDLAARHVVDGTGKAKRNEELRSMCAIGSREHACYLAAFRAASAVMNALWSAGYDDSKERA